MAVAPDTAPAASKGSEPPPAEQEDRLVPASVRRYAPMPLFVGAVLVALYLWVSGQELTSIGRRLLTAQTIQTLTVEHLQLTAVSTAIVLLLTIPMGIALTRPWARRTGITPAVVGVANVGQATPSIGMLVLVAIAGLTWFPELGRALGIGFGFRTAVIGLVAYSALPILRNTMVGLQQVDDFVIESARGMGMTKATTLRRIELPLAVPVILAGVRTALVINVGTASLATFINGGGLGDLINSGIANSRLPVLLTGAVLVAALALLVDWLAGIVEDVLRPRGL